MKKKSEIQAKFLSRTQVGLILAILALIIALSSVIGLAYINLNTASAFQSGYIIANLANVQREIVQLHMETNRMLRDRSKNFEPLELLRESLDKQMELALIESANNAQITQSLTKLQQLINQYDYEVDRLRVNATEEQFRISTHQFDSILDLLEKQAETLYGNEQIRFYHNIGDAIAQQRTSQALTAIIGTLILIFGILLLRSLGISVSVEFRRAYDLLKIEVNERRKAEEELLRQNAYLATLHETTFALMNRLEVEDLLKTIVARAAQLLNTEHGYVYLINPSHNQLERRVGVGIFSQSIGFRLQLGQGLAGQVWKKERPLAINDYNHWAYRVPTMSVTPNQDDIRSVMGVPLKSGQKVIGVIGLAHETYSKRTFGKREVELLQGFAQLASVALDNAQLFAQAEQRTLQMEALYSADEELYRHLESRDVLKALVNVAVDILKADKSSILAWNDTKTHLEPKASRGFSEQTLKKMTFTPDSGLVGHVATHQEPVIVKDTTSDKRVDWHITYPERIRSFMHVPVTVGDQVFGVFNVNYTQPQAFNEDDVRLVLALAHRAALAIENAQLYEQAQQAATLEERQRLARELHDAVTQTLFSASIIADVLPRLWEIDSQEAHRRLAELRELTRGAMAEMRTLLLELRPTALTEATLEELLHQLGEATTGRARVPVNVHINNAPHANQPAAARQLPPDVKVALYRIAQEALNNIAKHAQANQVEVSLTCNGHMVKLCIQDDGVGFNVGKILPDNLGLRFMQERAEQIAAQLDIDSSPGQGAAITVTWTA